MSPENYRLYCVDGAGQISLADWLTAESDQEAIEKARAAKDGARKCEVWKDRRLVATINDGRVQELRPWPIR